MKQEKCLLLITAIAAAASAQPLPPQVDVSNGSVMSVVGSPESSRDNRLIPPAPPQSVHRSTRAYIEIAPLNKMTVPNILKEIDKIQNTWEFSPFFSWNSDVQTFYSDSTRMIELIDSLKVRFASAAADDSKNTDKLVEVIRAGFYNGWSHSEVGYLHSGKPFIKRLGPAATAAVQNPSFGIATLEQARTVSALGAMVGAGFCSPEAAAGSAKIFKYYRTHLTEMNASREYGDALYALGTGIAYSIEGVEMYNLRWVTHQGDPKYYTYSSFYKKIDDLYTELELGSMTKEILDTQDWLANNYSYWLGTIGLAVERPRPQKALEKVISTYGKWPQVSLTAVQQLDYNYDGKYADGSTIDMDAVKEEVKQKFLPKTYRFDNGKIIFQTGDKVDPAKLEKLVWAMREVRSQFYRYAGRDEALEKGNKDDSLIAVIYNSPAEYKMNSFINGMSTNNGGLYIESYGTFYTYERTSQESIYTLEDLFRHEFTHYLQGRFLTPGLWDNASQEQNHLIWWDEGGAEFTAGSSRDNGITIRKAMVGNINPADGFTIDKTIKSTYNDGFTFYTYAFCLFSYLHEKEPAKLLSLVSLVQANKLAEFKAACEAMGKDPVLEANYQAWMKKLKSEYSTFTDPVTSDAYLASYKSIPGTEIRADLEKSAGVKLSEPAIQNDAVFAPFTVTGRMALQPGTSPENRWVKTDSAVTAMVKSLSGKTWEGYKTVSAYFTNRTADSCTITFYGNSGSSGTSADPEITIAVPTGLVYGSSLSESAASSTADGKFSAVPAFGTILPAGENSIAVTFTPTDKNLKPVTKTVIVPVAKAPLTVTAVNASKEAGAADPVLTFTFAGFVNSENESAVSVKPTISRASGETAGEYPITLSGGTAANYAFTYVPGTFRILEKTAITDNGFIKAEGLSAGIFAKENPVLGESAELIVVTGCASEIRVVILDPLGNLLDEQIGVTVTAGEPHTFSWNLRDRSGNPVGTGSYLAAARVKDLSTGSVKEFRTVIGVKK